MNLIIPPLNRALQKALQHKINQKTKPLGALGQLEALALQIGLLQNTLIPQLNLPTMMVFAGDHGIVANGVSPYPQAVTAQMVLNFLRDGAGINVFAKQNNMRLRIIDAGVNDDFSKVIDAERIGLIDAKIGMGTRNFAVEPAMTAIQCEQAMAHGIALAKQEIVSGSNVLGFGEMGIGNTAAASCIMSVLCALPLIDCVGRGTGLDDTGLRHKTQVLQAALALHAVSADEPMQVLATFGGFEIAMMTGAMLGAAQQGALVIVDGFIASAAALVAAKLQPNFLDYCVFAHCSGEAGHQRMLAHLAVTPLLNLGLRLGEGTGAALAYPLILAAVNFMNEMASFESAGVSEKL